MSAKIVHLVCSAHLDPVWLWEWEEGAAAALSTFRTAADFCEQHDHFIFNHNEALLYMWTEEYEPELFDRIKRLVSQGKWSVMGGWYVQPDCNMPSGESFVRQALIGKGYFREKFGVEPKTAVNFDSFGHTRGLVQILAKSGYDSYIFTRPDPNDITLPSEQFVWVGFDGSEIVATRGSSYGNEFGLARTKVEGDLKAAEDRPCQVALWGMGDHGGGPSWKDLGELDELIAEREDFDIKHSTLAAYFEELAQSKDSLPGHDKDLNPWAIGCYTSQVRIKQKHRLLENELYSAEKMASAAALQDLMTYPREELRSAFLDLLFSEFHDVLPGSSVQCSEDISIRKLDHGLEIVSRAKARAFFALGSGQEKARENEAPILVYNPHPFPITTTIECEFQLPNQHWGEEYILTPVYQDGKPVPYQNEKENSNIGIDWRKKVVFTADLAPGRMNRFDCRYETLPRAPIIEPIPAGDAFVFTNPDMEVVVSTTTGLIDRYRVNGVDYLNTSSCEPLVMMDDDDSWGYQPRSFGEIAGRFQLMSEERGTSFSGVTAVTLPSVRLIEDGAVRSIIEAVFEYGDSAICQRYILPKSGTEIEVQTRVHWNEKHRLLKLSIPTADRAARYLAQVAYGVQELPANGDEAVAQKWVAVVSSDKAVTVINAGSYGSDYSDHGLRLTLLRSPVYSGLTLGDRTVAPQDRYEPRIDQGERFFRFWINAGPAPDRLEKIDREALTKNEKPMALQMFPSGAGTMPQPLAILRGDAAVQMTAAKMAEDGDNLIVRLFEPTGQARAVDLSLPFCGIDARVELSAFEIKTLKINIQSKSITETDLMERPLTPGRERPSI